jgi:(p)ppGpp synthase/HD superfamily hydrolase
LRRSGVRDSDWSGTLLLVTIAQLSEVNPSFTQGLPMTRAALEFALERHAGQLRGDHYAPFVQHPLEVASLLSLAGYDDAVVASGVLHDVLENTYTDVGELEDRFGETVAALVQAVSEDVSITHDQARKSALRAQVARSSAQAAAIFAADKVSKVRELRARLSYGLSPEAADHKVDHYQASLAMLEQRLGERNALVRQLRFELEMLRMLQTP